MTIDSKTTRTITKIFEEPQEEAFTFRIPNMEEAINYEFSILRDIFKPAQQYLSNLSMSFPDALLNRNSVEVVRMLHDLLVSMSFHQHPSGHEDSPDRIFESEKIYHGLLHVSFLSAGFNVMSEASGGEGRSDITLFLLDKTCVVIELKYCAPSSRHLDASDGGDQEKQLVEETRKEKDLTTALNSAEEQMRKKDYAGPYRATGHKVICMALAIRARTEVAVRFVDIQTANEKIK
ncbi:MAG: PD-(D/E)XK nuclease domain-containing protein [Deltaproteobacteria bacterium]|nr:PD-(D/E)XK nuclease domain-containing protein [Deltaproteobacteria bacterium]